MLHINVNAKIVKFGTGLCANIHKSIKQLYIFNCYYEKQKAALFLLIPDDTSVKNVCKVECKKKNFYEEEELIKINDIYNKDNSKDYVFIKKQKNVENIK